MLKNPIFDLFSLGHFPTFKKKMAKKKQLVPAKNMLMLKIKHI